jgi:beta-glucanase (GH16 family)
MRLLLAATLSLFLITSSCKENTSNSEPEVAEGLIWSDEFDGTEWDRNEWIPEFGDSGWGNQEYQNYTASKENLSVSDGTLKITAVKVGDGQGRGDYTSARITSARTFGPGTIIEVRAKIPDYRGDGLWPAIWMLGDSIRKGTPWPTCGEIDIMEYVSRAPDVFFSTIHSAANNHTNGTQIGSGNVSLPNIEEEFNTFGIEWHEEYIKFFVNDQDNVIFRINRPQDYNLNNWPFSEPHFFLLNLAVGGTFGGFDVNDDNFPAVFEIDYVRVYELEE